MSFQGLDFILQTVANRPEWDAQKQYLQLCQQWEKVVSAKVALNSRPHHLSQGILWVGVSSSAWSQELSLRRYGLLKKLNQTLESEITDLRFSTALWHQSLTAQRHRQEEKSMTHPSQRGGEEPDWSQVKKGETPLSAFASWQQQLDLRSQSFPLCPQCHAPAPPGELQRWGVCSLCFPRLGEQ